MKFDLNDELEAIRDNLIELPYDYVTLDQLKALGSLMSSGMEKPTREKRIAMLRLWCGQAMWDNFGIEIQSSKNITRSIASYLIGLLKGREEDDWELTQYGRLLIEQSEKNLKIPTQSN